MVGDESVDGLGVLIARTLMQLVSQVSSRISGSAWTSMRFDSDEMNLCMHTSVKYLRAN